MEERSFILKYRQVSSQGKEFAREKLREEEDRAERDRAMGKKRGTGT